ncbi:flagellin N-terminal helical domain-containing protein [Achromobacter xylosoxidans]|uniref:flagellin N-terminal helical domain-containing protein n=1 Tax=Alcaligenes xylosoxydans xylosoxydans TaxID=85698 RepID=UPI0006BF6E1D|nr:flagellin [Achromobacter xylosoxidans]MCH4574282.1 flagellin FliC [Achromobacter xylosoxidans]MDD7988732.1 flagellin [Achromobacter xylosoxidans]NEV04977.1 flagellin FliC [Achromobacter xylosoxidans]OFO60734.1 flagellin [Achromobacter xylosoxidans]OMG75980.1 flagellin [Achromobacter xylosoxidans]
MAAVINTNYLSLVAQNNLNKSQSALGTAIERLSSGLRINSAKDDAAGMAIANRFTSNVRGLTQASRNANDGISLAQTTEGAASEVTTHLQRVRELTVQAANGSYSQEQLDSIQDEIKQRMADIDRISQQTDFNGVKVLSSNAKPLTLQVGANDGETITLNLSEISSKTLGLNGFNVNGKGVIDNTKASVNNLLAAGAPTPAAATPNDYVVTTTFAKVSAEQAFAKLENGNTVTVAGATAAANVTYTYDAANDNFTFDNKTTTATLGALVTSLTPATGTVTGTYTNKGTAAATFEVDAAGNVTIGGKAAFLTTTGELTTNNAAGTVPAASLTNILTATSKAAANDATLSIGGKVYNSSGTAGEVHYVDTKSKDAVLTAFKAGPVNSNVVLGDGLASVTLAFTSGQSTDTYVDDAGEFTKITGGTFTTTYTNDPTTGTVTVKAGSGTGAYAPKIGATVYMSSSGKLTTETTSKGDKTTDPLKTLDAAFNVLNKLTGELGAVQNRLESTIANLNNVINNLSGARSRILDADYATEVSNMSKAQILQQAGTSVLAQANQVPQTVLSLLR